LREQGMSQAEATKWTNAVLMGAPSLLGLDISGSLALFDLYGQTPYEQIVGQFTGPTVGRAIQVGGGLAAAADAARTPMGPRDRKTPQEKSMTAVERALKASPQYGMGKAAWQLASEGRATMRINSKDEPMTRFESAMRALGFTPARQSGFYEQQDYLRSVGALDRASLQSQPLPPIGD
jgi:hypothetical protein